MKTKFSLIFGAAVPLLLAGCASAPPVAEAPSTPAPVVQVSAGTTGHLQVYGGTPSQLIGNFNRVNPSNGFSIYDLSNNLVAAVPDHAANAANAPAMLDLPAGSYKIVVKSAAPDAAAKPVVIKADRTTVVTLGQ